MANLYNEITDAVEDIRQLKGFIIFEGSKFINQIIDSFSKDFTVFLKEKLKISETEVEAKETPPKSMTIWEKIFRKKEAPKPSFIMPVDSFNSERFKQIIAAIEEWNQTNNKKFSDEKFKMIRLFAERLTKIEENLLNLYADTRDCEQLKGEKKLWHKKFKNLSKEKLSQLKSPISEPVQTTPEVKPSSRKRSKIKPEVEAEEVPPLPPPEISPEEMDKIYSEKTNNLLEEIKSIFISSDKIKNEFKIGFENQIEKHKNELLKNLKNIVIKREDKLLIEKAKEKINKFNDTNDTHYLISFYDTIGLSKS